ncbi:MAG: DUF4197 domain-containing protein [Flavobacteriales bacterium]|nr:DUF4197 domain-containing protein [Bacteroidota bacterium]MCB9241244.1 DUF4197 domain-containing protein [Flavobacteriales bacterium]
MKRIVYLLLISLSLFTVSCDEVTQIIEDNELTEAEVVEGLKMALTVGTDTSVTTLAAVDGYLGDELVKILLPEEAAVIVTNIAKVPGGNLLIDKTIQAINRSAEDAAPEAKSIFVNAITNITIEDGFAILKGENDAATTYLKTNTESQLSAAFSPKISASLNKKLVGNISAESAYSDLISAYNTASLNGVLFPKVTTNSLTEHTTQKALDGLFLKVSVEEENIRTIAAHRVNDILKKVFGE